MSPDRTEKDKPGLGVLLSYCEGGGAVCDLSASGDLSGIDIL